MKHLVFSQILSLMADLILSVTHQKTSPLVGINLQTTNILKKAEPGVELLCMMARPPAKSDMLMGWREGTSSSKLWCLLVTAGPQCFV